MSKNRFSGETPSGLVVLFISEDDFTSQLQLNTGLPHSGTNWATLAPNGTNLGLFKIRKLKVVPFGANLTQFVPQSAIFGSIEEIMDISLA